MNQHENTRNITLLDLKDILIHRILIILIIAVASVSVTWIYTHVTFEPEYKSTATLYILRQNENEAVNGSSDDFSLALKVVNDCDYLLKSHSVLDEVIRNLDLDVGYGQLNKSITTSNPENTRILEVTVRADSPEKAKRTVDALCEIGQDKIAEAMGFQQVNLYEYGTLESAPCNTTGFTTYLLIGIIAAVLTYAVFFITYLMDDRIRTDEDIERYLGLSVLGDIPNANEVKKHRYGYYSGYGAENTKLFGKKEKS